MASPRLPAALKAAAFVAWLLGSAFGFTLLWSYAGAAGRAAAPPSHWPAESSAPAPDGRPELVLFAHPRCPCTRATMEELDRLMARSAGACSACVLFFTPADAAPGWADTDLWAHAARIPGVTVLADPGGAEALRFGASTSGQVLLYGAEGELLFQGGITASRGHVGDNAGAAAILALLRGKPAAGQARTPVFGCPIEEACPQSP